MYLVNDMKKKEDLEYDDFVNNPPSQAEIEMREAEDELVEQEIFNFKVEQLIGIDKDKQIFDTKYKQSLWEYINKNSVKDRKNSGTVVGMTVFGVMGLIIFSGTIYLSLLGGLLGLGVGRMIGSRLQS